MTSPRPRQVTKGRRKARKPFTHSRVSEGRERKAGKGRERGKGGGSGIVYVIP